MNIKSAEAHQMARKLAQLRGVSITAAVVEALQEKLERENHRGRGKSLANELLAIGKRCAAHMKRPIKSSDHAKMLYDSKGLPR